MRARAEHAQLLAARTTVADSRVCVRAAVQKAMYKPAAFFKGILLPIAEVQCSTARTAQHCTAPHRTAQHSTSRWRGNCALTHAGPRGAQNGCNVRQAVIMASILNKTSIPVRAPLLASRLSLTSCVQAMHASVALLKLAQLPYTGAGTLFMKTLLDKKYNLPYKVIDGLVTHFVSFIKRTEDGEEARATQRTAPHRTLAHR